MHPTLARLWQHVRANPDDRAAHEVLIDALFEHDAPVAPAMLEGLRAGSGPLPRELEQLVPHALSALASELTHRWGVPRGVVLDSFDFTDDDLPLTELCEAERWAGITRLQLQRGPGHRLPPPWLLQEIVRNASDLRELANVPFDVFPGLCGVDRALERVTLSTDPHPNIELGLYAAHLRIKTLVVDGPAIDTDESALWWLLHHGRRILEHVEVLELPGAAAEGLGFILDQRWAALREVRAGTWTCERAADGTHFTLTELRLDGRWETRLDVHAPLRPTEVRPVRLERAADCPFASPELADLVHHLCRPGREAVVEGFEDGAWALTVTGENLLEPHLDLLDLLPAEFSTQFRRVEVPWDPWGPHPEERTDRSELRLVSEAHRMLLTVTTLLDQTQLQLVALATEAHYARVRPHVESPLFLGPALTARFAAGELVSDVRLSPAQRDARIARRRADRLARLAQEDDFAWCGTEDLPF